MTSLNNSYFLITGMSRSGTTLVDKILDSHNNVRAISQPIPKLYRYIKKLFFKNIGNNEEYYVLNDLFNNDKYTRREFLDFLNNYYISKLDLKTIFKDMQGWSGQYTSFDMNRIVENYEISKFSDFYKFFIQELNEYEGVFSFGTKEILIEEFIEYFLNNGIKVILIIRDPRDVYTSLNVGDGTNYGGKHRPTLFHLRNWRKSVAIANTFYKHKNCLVIKYEDLVSNYEYIINDITKFLDIPKFPTGYFNMGIRQKGEGVWKGNSSTNINNGIVSQNKNKYKKYLSEQTISYIEYICKPEMLLFNYELNSEISDPANFTEPFEINECGLDKNMSISLKELKIEKDRIELLSSDNASNKNIDQLFYSFDNYERLKKVLK